MFPTMTVDDLVTMINGSSWNCHLYHFTDGSNLSSINKTGLLSKVQMKTRGLSIPTHTASNKFSQNLDAHKGLDAYVNLCMTKDPPLLHRAKEEGRLPDPRCLAITPDVLRRDWVRIALGVANANGTEILPLGEALALGKVDAEVLYKRTDWTDPAFQQRRQAVRRWEILVPKCVPRDRIARGLPGQFRVRGV